MNCVKGLRRALVVFAASALVMFAVPAFAQDISDSHLKAARAAVTAIRATDLMDGILPASAAALKQALIEKNPNLSDLIVSTVDAKTLEMAGRRADLEKEAALAYARVFTEDDCNAIAAFYNGETGKKLLANGGSLSHELSKAADVWQTGIARDLATEVGKVLAASLPAAPADGGAPAPSTGDATTTPPADPAAN